MTTQLSLLDAPRCLRSFEELAAAVMARRRGMTLQEVGTADTLARELAKDRPDRERVGWMARRLGLNPNDLEV
ncbi:MAG TPA: hypothetical protein VLH75_20585 [Longimicrobiales bacterium]|nr:hypothetical protein [Longimicrobiales bacterium]